MSAAGALERAALVTGGARGIGLAIVEALAERGDRVTIADVDLERATQSAADLESRGHRVAAVALDVTNVEQVHRMLGEVDAETPLTTVVCNAGLGMLGGVLDTSEAEYDRVLAVNLKGVFFTMQAALRLMVPRGTGSVVSISSTSGLHGVEHADGRLRPVEGGRADADDRRPRARPAAPASASTRSRRGRSARISSARC